MWFIYLIIDLASMNPYRWTIIKGTVMQIEKALINDR